MKEKFARGRFKLGWEQITKMSHKGRKNMGRNRGAAAVGGPR